MHRRRLFLSLILPGVIALFAVSGYASPEGPARISAVADLGSLFGKPLLRPLKIGEGLVALRQDPGEEWGWHTAGKEEEPQSQLERETFQGDEKFIPVIRPTRAKKSPRSPRRAEERPTPSGEPSDGDIEGRRTAMAERFRIGLEAGGFIPFGEKEEAFNTGLMGGVFAGFGLPTLIQGLTITSELSLLAGMTSSEQEGGIEVSSTIVMVRDDFLFHFFPNEKSFNLYYFIGISFGYEMTSADSPASSGTGTETDSGTAVWFLFDTGLGSWVNLGGPVDLILKIDFNLVPITDNIPFFIVGQVGIQVKL
ncbi:MAG: hypothetical protein ACYTHM_06020 [Planctomycetota bacterium]